MREPIIWRNHGQLGFRFSLSRWTGWHDDGCLCIFATIRSNKMLTTLFLCLFGFFFLPPKFPSGAFVVWEAIQNEWVAWWVSYNLLQNEATKCSQLFFFLSFFVIFPPPNFNCWVSCMGMALNLGIFLCPSM
jgi:hypothetical protein